MIRKTVLLLLACLLVGVFGTAPALACTTFCVNTASGPLCAGNYDWDTDIGALMFNKRHVSKSSSSGPNGAQWVSLYASLTFNQYGRDNPTGGMNEAGLSIQLMELESTAYPADARPTVGVLGWIQYQLDQSATVEEVLWRSEQVRIAGQPGLHYLVGDRSGNVATVEFLNGKLVAHQSPELIAPVLTNDRYDVSADRLKEYVGFGGAKPLPAGSGSIERFVRTAGMIAAAPPDEDWSSYAFDLLASVRQPHTRWTMIYDPVGLTVSFRTEANAAMRTVSLRQFDPSCSTAVKMVDVHLGAGPIDDAFVDYTTAANLDLMVRSFAATPIFAGFPPALIEAEAMRPESSQCFAPRRRAARSGT